MVTVAGLRRSGGVDGRSFRFRTHRSPRATFDWTSSELRGGLGLAGDPDDVDRRWIGTDEVFGVRLHDSEPCSVQDARDETSTSYVAVRPLQRQLHSPVRTSS